ncbi:MAG: hypothetical protein NTW01_01330 [Gammaproteobacteria bacterium]|nr:hypothetical protein [Gammaproteobacteria bacterium]
MSNHHSRDLRKLSREQLIAQLEAERESMARARFARRIAPEFIRAYGLFPYGVNLIPWLTRSRCRTNSEALVDWIERQLVDAGFADDARETPKSIVLACRLQKLLATVEAAHPW